MIAQPLSDRERLSLSVIILDLVGLAGDEWKCEVEQWVHDQNKNEIHFYVAVVRCPSCMAYRTTRIWCHGCYIYLMQQNFKHGGCEYIGPAPLFTTIQEVLK